MKEIPSMLANEIEPRVNPFHEPREAKWGRYKRAEALVVGSNTTIRNVIWLNTVPSRVQLSEYRVGHIEPDRKPLEVFEKATEPVEFEYGDQTHSLRLKEVRRYFPNGIHRREGIAVLLTVANHAQEKLFTITRDGIEVPTKGGVSTHEQTVKEADQVLEYIESQLATKKGSAMELAQGDLANSND